VRQRHSVGTSRLQATRNGGLQAGSCSGHSCAHIRFNFVITFILAVAFQDILDENRCLVLQLLLCRPRHGHHADVRGRLGEGGHQSRSGRRRRVVAARPVVGADAAAARVQAMLGRRRWWPERKQDRSIGGFEPAETWERAGE
jgi:hypothetical protein